MSRRQHPRPHRMTVFGKAALALAGCALALVAAEFLLIAHYGSQPGLVRAPGFASPYLYVLEPGLGAANRQSILRADRVEEAASGLRVLSYGDSIGTGYGIEASSMYAVRLERALQARADAASAAPGVGSKVEILSMARGHSPTAYAFHMRANVDEFDPDAVIVIIELSNDVGDEARVATRGRDADGIPTQLRGYRYALSWDDQLLAPIPLDLGALGLGALGLGAIERTRLYYAISRFWGRVLGRLQMPPAFRADSDTYYYALRSERFLLDDARLASGFERLFESLAGMQHALAREERAFLVALLPSRYAFEPAHQYHPGALRLLARGERRASELGIPLLSLRSHFAAAGGAALYQDFCHPTATGNAVIARALEPIVSQWTPRARSAVRQN